MSASINNRKRILRYLTTPDPEEDEHPWQAPPFRLNEKPVKGLRQGIHVKLPNTPLLRIFDRKSGSSPANLPDGTTNWMPARAWRMKLYSKEQRIDVLKSHSDYWDSAKTPFISFTSNPRQLEIMTARFHKTAPYGTRGKRGPFQVVIIDPVIRSAKGVPTLYYPDEIAHYNIRLPLREGDQTDHYLCLWQVGHDEVVGVYDWDTLRATDGWYEKIVLPAFRDHREKYWLFLEEASEDYSTSGASSADQSSDDDDNDSVTWFQGAGSIQNADTESLCSDLENP